MIYKGGRYYMAKFMWKGKLIRKSTQATDKKTARQKEAQFKTDCKEDYYKRLKKAEELGCSRDDLVSCVKCEKLFNGAAAITVRRLKFCGASCRDTWEREHRIVPTLGDFLKCDFLPYVDNTAAKESTATYYHDGAKRLLDSDLANLRLDKITDQQAAQFAARYSHLSASSINCGLRTLRRALHLAYEWGKLERMPKISLAKGERQRDRVLTREEADDYLAMCSQPWRDCATLLLGTGIRPGEAYKLRWEHVCLNGNGGMIQITEGKTKAARRMLPMVPPVYEALKTRHVLQGKPESGWVFPSGSRSGHLEESSAKKWHGKALARLCKAHEIKAFIPMIEPFQPYVMRHSCLTWLAESGCDAFTLARIAGHSNITITQRYCHPQAEAIERAFAQVTAGRKVVTDGGQRPKLTGANQSTEIGVKSTQSIK